MHALLSSVMYILSGENITAMFTISQRCTQVANRLDQAGATYVRLLHVPPWYAPRTCYPAPYEYIRGLSDIISPKLKNI
jgi:hypothetical protein